MTLENFQNALKALRQRKPDPLRHVRRDIVKQVDVKRWFRDLEVFLGRSSFEDKIYNIIGAERPLERLALEL